MNTRWVVSCMLAGMAGLMGACTVGPNYRAPDVRIDASFLPSSVQNAEAGKWWAALGDPTLDRLIRLAADNSLDLRLAQARIREARAQRAAVFGTAEPNVNLGGQYNHQRFSQNAAPFNAFDVPNFPWEFNLYQLGFDASWEIDIFGGTRRAIEAANASVQASEEDRRAVLVSLLGEVARNYVELRAAQDRRLIAEHNLAGQKQTVDLTRERVNKGVGSQLDVSRAVAQAAETAAEIPVYRQREWLAIHRLAVLTNAPIDSLADLHTDGAVPAAPASVMVGVPADLLRRRPDIRRVERLLAVATARIGVAEAELYPRLSLTGFFNLQSASIEDLFNWRSRAFSIGPAVSWPIFEAGRLRALVAVRNAQQEQALVTYEETVQNAIAEVRDQMVTLSSERQRQASLEEAVAAHQQSLDLASQLYGQGLTDFLTVLDAQRQLYQSQDELSASRARLTESVIALYKSLGGGWEAGGGLGVETTAATMPASMPGTEPTTPAPPATRPAATQEITP